MLSTGNNQNAQCSNFLFWSYLHIMSVHCHTKQICLINSKSDLWVSILTLLMESPLVQIFKKINYWPIPGNNNSMMSPLIILTKAKLICAAEVMVCKQVWNNNLALLCIQYELATLWYVKTFLHTGRTNDPYYVTNISHI